MFLAGAQRLSQTHLGLLGYLVCRHRYDGGEEGELGGGMVSSFGGYRGFLRSCGSDLSVSSHCQPQQKQLSSFIPTPQHHHLMENKYFCPIVD